MKKEEIAAIPISEIYVPNPRKRSRQKWIEIVNSIREVGLKRPITVSRRSEPTADGKWFDLVCGQGRIDAFAHLGETTIPAIVTTVPGEDQSLMSLVENLARRKPSARDILREVSDLRARANKPEQIAAKLGVDVGYFYGIVHLLEHGNERLIESVKAGRLPLRTAIGVATGKGHAASLKLSEACQSDRRRREKRKTAEIAAPRHRKLPTQNKSNRIGKRPTARAMVRIYEQTVREQRALVVRAEEANNRMRLLCSAFRHLSADGDFVKLLQAENLSNMPENLAERLR